MSTGESAGGGDSPQLKEWTECRTTIGRLDTILQDLRKYGFTLISGLLTASSFIGYGSGNPGAGVGAFIAVMCLVAGLFSVDIYYSVLQSAAVERALDLESRADRRLADPPILITATMSRRSLQAKSKFIILGVYVLLLVVAGVLGIVSASLSGTYAAPLTVATAVVGGLLVLVMLGHWRYASWMSGMHRQKPNRDWPADIEQISDPPRTGRWWLPGFPSRPAAEAKAAQAATATKEGQ